MTEENLRPKVVDLGNLLARHMVIEDQINSFIMSLSLTEEEANFLEECILR